MRPTCIVSLQRGNRGFAYVHPPVTSPAGSDGCPHRPNAQNSASGTWTKTGNMKNPRAAHIATLDQFDARIIFVTKSCDSICLIDPSTRRQELWLQSR
jgi:hypothetical protein